MAACPVGQLRAVCASRHSDIGFGCGESSHRGHPPIKEFLPKYRGSVRIESQEGQIYLRSSERFLSWELCSGSLRPACRRPNRRKRISSMSKIDGLHNEKGQVLCALFSSAEGFPKNSAKAAAHVKSDISHGHAFCEFPGIPSGTYAVSAFHDENSNGKMDTNFMGIPREGWPRRTTQGGILGPRNSKPLPFISQAVGPI